MGNDFNEVVAMFLEEVGEVITRLEAAPDQSSFATDLHFLKGAALNLGFSEFAARCELGEMLAGQGRAGEIDLGRILVSYHQSREAFVQGLNRSAA